MQQLNLETMAGAQNIHEARLSSVSTVLQTEAVKKEKGILKSFGAEGSLSEIS